jgi:hypothetical protein
MLRNEKAGGWTGCPVVPKSVQSAEHDQSPSSPWYSGGAKLQHLLDVQQVQVQGYSGNYHYQRLATHMGAQYQLVVSTCFNAVFRV